MKKAPQATNNLSLIPGGTHMEGQHSLPKVTQLPSTPDVHKTLAKAIRLLKIPPHDAIPSALHFVSSHFQSWSLLKPRALDMLRKHYLYHQSQLYNSFPIPLVNFFSTNLNRNVIFF